MAKIDYDTFVAIAGQFNVNKTLKKTVVVDSAGPVGTSCARALQASRADLHLYSSQFKKHAVWFVWSRWYCCKKIWHRAPETSHQSEHSMDARTRCGAARRFNESTDWLAVRNSETGVTLINLFTWEIVTKRKTSTISDREINDFILRFLWKTHLRQRPALDWSSKANLSSGGWRTSHFTEWVSLDLTCT